ncbi:flavodoxin family protein [Dehalogenimonas etheniformans]|uniref:Flavodoxin family protein n=1 Tax=Dehalogenimonas etheniformans TaxID=1536648 RepID=A0A2P5P5F2_9CHLR|nr:flavodoxin family protein [Dehalogenimonas etheniformans]PPD57523.1 flavodoxin family protein [Dehalogenimonas etheniformans]QNT76884.1 flavodoxin family protein [Dehalogenimonas etheniformans]
MNVLGLSGSPRMGGNTEHLLYEFLRGAREAGANTRLIEVAELNISGCLHCDYCSRTGQCKINDDMELIYDALSAADIIVVASPLHFMSVTAQLKAAIDRCQCLWARKYQLKLAPIEPVKRRKGFFICVGGRKGQTMFEPARATVKALFVVLDIGYAGELLFADVDEAGAIKNVPGAMEQAFEAGRKLVQ